MLISPSSDKWISTYGRLRNVSHTVATEKQRVFPLTERGQIKHSATELSHLSGKRRADAKSAVSNSQTCPPKRMIIRSQHIELTAYPTDNFLCPKRLPSRSYLFGRKPSFKILFFQPIEFTNTINQIFSIPISILFEGVNELCTSMRLSES